MRRREAHAFCVKFSRGAEGRSRGNSGGARSAGSFHQAVEFFERGGFYQNAAAAREAGPRQALFPFFPFAEKTLLAQILYVTNGIAGEARGFGGGQPVTLRPPAASGR